MDDHDEDGPPPILLAENLDSDPGKAPAVSERAGPSTRV